MEKGFKGRFRVCMAIVVAVIFAMSPLAFAARGLTSGDQAIYGAKSLEHNVTFKKNVTIEGVLLGVAQYSNVFYVNSDSGHDSAGNNGSTYLKPFATIDYALAQCTADNGDIIYVLPGHTVTIIAAGTLTFDVAGVSIIGLGKGSLRPMVTYTTANTACVLITASDVSIENFIFNANYADVAMAIDVDGTDFTIKKCLFKEQATNMNFFSLIGTDDTDNAADGLTIIGNERISIDAGALAFVSILGNCNRLKISGNFDNQASAANIGHFLIMADKVCLGAQIVGNVLNLTGDNNAQTVGIFATGSSITSTGIMAYNLCGSLDATTEFFDTATLDFQHFENYCTGTLAKSGTILPAIE